MACHWRFRSPLWSSDALTQRKMSLGIGMSGDFFFFKSCVGWDGTMEYIDSLCR